MHKIPQECIWIDSKGDVNVLNGKIYSCITYNRALPIGEFYMINFQLMKKWNIPTTFKMKIRYLFYKILYFWR